MSDSLSSTTSPLILSASGQPLVSASISGTLEGHGFSRLEVATARVVVKRLVQAQMRKGPNNYLLLLNHEVEELWDREAVQYLKEQYAARNAGKHTGV